MDACLSGISTTDYNRLSFSQSVKNLVFLSKVLHQLHLSEEVPFSAVMDEMSGGVSSDHVTAAATGEEGGSDRTRDLYWLIDRMSRLAKYEAARHPKEKMKVRLVDVICVLAGMV